MKIYHTFYASKNIILKIISITSTLWPLFCDAWKIIFQGENVSDGQTVIKCIIIDDGVVKMNALNYNFLKC